MKVLIGKIGLDGHDRGAKVIASALRDAGMEVVYSGLHKTPDDIVHAALQEDVDVIGISILSGAHMTLIPDLLDELADNEMEDVPLVVGGIIPDDDAEQLKELGVAEIFRPGAPLKDIVDYIRNNVESGTAV
jgi:methylmalonyl-CoA mutase C-terminal domain/subunit